MIMKITNDCTTPIAKAEQRTPIPDAEQTQQEVKNLLNAYRPLFKDAEYMPSTQHLFGIMMARFFRWNGNQIMEASIEALEDANFSTEASQIRDIMELEKEDWEKEEEREFFSDLTPGGFPEE